jgi:hypothetical protein
MERADSILARISDTHPDLRITKHVRKRVEMIELVRERADGPAPLLFSSRPFLLCGLPLKRPPSDALEHTRRNGRFILQVHGNPKCGLPFGQDRLIPLWVASQAIKQKSRTIVFSSGADILNELGLPLDGPHYRRLLDGFKRVFASTIFFGTDEQLATAEVWDFSRFCFFDRLRLWNNKADQADAAEEKNLIVLSEAFWTEVRAHPIPIDRDIVRSFANAPGTLDFYMWISWRCYRLPRAVQISLWGAGGLSEQLGATDYVRARDFRRTVCRWVAAVKQFWPTCPVRISSGGQMLLIEPEDRSSVRSADHFSQ